MADILAVGKLDMEFLAALLEQYAETDDERVVVGPRVGEDALVLDFGDRYLVAKTDPITFATDEIGWYAVNVNANDIATTGATCRWFLATLHHLFLIYTNPDCRVSIPDLFLIATAPKTRKK